MTSIHLIAGATALALAVPAVAQTASSTVASGHSSAGANTGGHRVSAAKARQTATHAQPRTAHGHNMPNGHASTRHAAPRTSRGGRAGSTGAADMTTHGGSVGGSAPNGAGTAGSQTGDGTQMGG